MGFRTKFGWLILNIIIIVLVIVAGIIECAVPIVAFFPALIINRYPKWGKFPLTTCLSGWLPGESVLARPVILDRFKH